MLAAANGNALAVFDSARAVRALKPDFRKVAALEPFGVIATGPGEDCDFVSRYFVPKAGLDEDPVTGSAHCTLVPYWSARLGKHGCSRGRSRSAAANCGARIAATAC